MNGVVGDDAAFIVEPEVVAETLLAIALGPLGKSAASLSAYIPDPALIGMSLFVFFDDDGILEGGKMSMSISIPISLAGSASATEARLSPRLSASLEGPEGGMRRPRAKSG